MDYSEWIGKTVERTELLSQDHATRIAATLDETGPADGGELPLLWHWAYFPDLAFTSTLQIDGHARTGDFLPAAGDRVRMWAGGRLTFMQPLRVGVKTTRRSTIKAITEKQGRTGALLFVTVQHEYSQDKNVCLTEEQDIVYRQAVTAVGQGEPLPEADWTGEVETSPTLLFRYSAVTFNTHRIHYDWRYVTETEGYPGLVVHGPLTATLVMRAFAKHAPESTVRTFAFKGVRPLIAGDTLIVGGQVEGPGRASVWAGNSGGLGQAGEITFD